MTAIRVVIPSKGRAKTIIENTLAMFPNAIVMRS